MRVLVFVLMLLTTAPALAVEPGEMLSDPDLEARAQVLDMELRCVQCQSESIASSNAEWARDARKMVRALIAEGASNQDVLVFFAERYGDVVLMRPRSDGANLLLWVAGPAALVLAFLLAGFYLKGRNRPAGGAALTKKEAARLQELLDE